MEYSENEYIKLNRKIIRWEWYMNINVKTLFIHCLLKANWKDGRFEGKEIKRGSFVTSLEKLSIETGMSVRQIRTALDKLQMTGELTSKSYSKYRIITVVNYTQYQACDKQVDKQSVNLMTSKRQADDKQVTTIEEVKKERSKEVKKDYLLNNSNELFNCPSEMDEKPKSLFEDQLRLWNSLEGFGIKPIRAITEQRAKLLKPRLKQYGDGSFAECIEQIKHSDFLQGKHGGKPWVITFDWMILPSNYPKVLEGNYRNQKDSSGENQSKYLQDIMKMIGE